MYNWDLAFKVFFYGFSGVFICLIILMFFVQISGMVFKNFRKKKS